MTKKDGFRDASFSGRSLDFFESLIPLGSLRSLKDRYFLPLIVLFLAVTVVLMSYGFDLLRPLHRSLEQEWRLGYELLRVIEMLVTFALASHACRWLSMLFAFLLLRWSLEAVREGFQSGRGPAAWQEPSCRGAAAKRLAKPMTLRLRLLRAVGFGVVFAAITLSFGHSGDDAGGLPLEQALVMGSAWAIMIRLLDYRQLRLAGARGGAGQLQ